MKIGAKQKKICILNINNLPDVSQNTIKTKQIIRMKHLKKIVFLLGILCCLNACNTNKDVVFNEIYSLIEEKNFFKAEERYNSIQSNLSETHKRFTEAILDNAFNRLEKSEKEIDYLLKNKNSIPDSLIYMLFAVHKDNSLKLFHYKEAKNAVATILKDYKKHLTEKQLEDYENDLKLWTALGNTPPQKVVIRTNSIIQTKKDMAGVNTLNVSFENDSLDLIFDTGANLSTTSTSTAKHLKMKIIPVDINVGSSTSQKVLAQLAVCEKFTIGHIDVYNAVFLVVPDELLIFEEGNYQIYGILGFPVMQALKEIKITQDGEFIVPKEESTFTGNSNFAMDELMPLICIEGKHYRFDSGANHTELYYKFYVENKEEIERQYKPQKFKSAGVAGEEEYIGYLINHTFNVSGKDVTLKNIKLLKNTIYHDETYYGNIGQDLIKQFNTMTLNFDQMFIKFE